MKKNRVKKAKPKKQKQESSKPSDNENEMPFDFGGIPDRDLKKNLGCG